MLKDCSVILALLFFTKECTVYFKVNDTDSLSIKRQFWVFLKYVLEFLLHVAFCVSKTKIITV